VVNSTTSAWKAQEAQLKAVGNYTQAAEAKYKGLGDAIQAQQSKIDTLKQKQSDLKGNTQETAEQYLKYQQQIDQATTRLASMQAQQEKAKGSMDYYKSGLADLQRTYREANELSKSRVERLQAEGKTSEALKARIESNQASVKNLTKQYELQEKALQQMARSGDTSSRAYQIQQQRLNETATALAKAKSEQEKLNDELKKANPSFLEKVRAKIQEVGKETESTRDKAEGAGNIFKQVFSANVISAAFMNGLNFIKNTFSDLLKSGSEYIRYQQTMTASWNTLTGSAEQGKVMVDMTNEMAQAASNSARMVDELNKKLYAVTENADKTRELTKTILTLQDAFGVEDAAIQNFATQWGQMLGNGKVQAQDMLSFMNVFPTLKKEMIGIVSEMRGGVEITNTAFAEMQKNGEITSDIANQALTRMGEKYKDATANFANTTEGLERTIKGRGPALVAAFEKPFLDMKNPILKVASEWVASDKTAEQFNKLGQSASKGLDVIVEAFKKVFDFGDKGEFMDKIMESITKFVEKSAQTIADNAPAIKDFFEETKKGAVAIWEIAKPFAEGTWDVVKDTAGFIAEVFKELSGSADKSGKPIKGVADGLQEISKHKEAIKATGTAFMAYFIGSKIVSGITAAAGAITGFAKAVAIGFNTIAASPAGLIATAVAGVVIGFIALYKHAKPFRDFVDGIIKACADFFKGFGKFFGGVFKKVGKFFSDFGKGFGKVVKAIGDGVGAIGKFLGGIVKGVVEFGKNVAKVLIFANPFVLGFALMYKHSKPFRNFIKGIVKGAKALYDGFNKFFGNIGKFVGKTFDGVKKNVTEKFEAVSGFIGKTNKAINKSWDESWRQAGKFFSDTWDGMNKVTKDKFGKDIKTLLMDNLSEIGKNFQETWDGIGKGFGKLWDGMKKLAQNGINAVIKIPNAGIDGINSLIHDFGGPKETIGKIPEVKFASGTGFFSQHRNPITKPVLATLNDGNDSPETGNQEMVIMPNGNNFLVPGRNTKMLLPAGAEVLNASETAWIMGVNQQAFAKGTGFFQNIWNGITSFGGNVAKVTGNLWDGLKDGIEKFTKMLDFIGKAVTDPSGTLKDKFNPSSKGMKGMFDNFGGVLFKRATDGAGTWWKELWGMAKSASDEGGVAGNMGDDYNPKWRAMAKDAIADPWGYFIRECVSFVANRLNNLGVPASKFSFLGNGSDWVNARVPHTNNPRPGMVAVYGPGSQFGNHVAMVSGVSGGTISGEEYNWLGDGNYHTYSGRPISGVTTFLDFGVRGGDSNTPALSEANNPLQKHIKKQVGGMFDWIKKFLAPQSEDGAGPTGGGTGVERWRNTVIRALKKNGFEASDSQVNAWMRVIQRESNGDPRAVNNWDSNAAAGIPSKGLVQTIEPTFNAYKFPGHNDIFNGYDNLLAGIAYAAARYGRGPGMFARVSGPLGYANGGLVTKHGLYEVAEGNQPEYIIPMDAAKRGRAWKLLQRIVGQFVGEHPTDPLGGRREDDSALDKLSDKLDTLIELMTQLVLGQDRPIDNRLIVDGLSFAKELTPFMVKAQTSYNRRMESLEGR
jgi:tape measure domain-containing protein